MYLTRELKSSKWSGDKQVGTVGFEMSQRAWKTFGICFSYLLRFYVWLATVLAAKSTVECDFLKLGQEKATQRCNIEDSHFGRHSGR